MGRRNVFVMGLEEENLAALGTIRHARDCDFHALLGYEEVVHVEEYPLARMLDQCRRILDSFDGSVDAIIGHWDFPTTSMVPILCREYGLRAPSLESVLRCSHKYWSRLEQRKAIPEHTPHFQKVDPFDPNALDRIQLGYPFWVKPVKSFASQLGFEIADPADFEEAMHHIRAHIGKVGAPFDIVLDHAELPPEIAAVDGFYCIAEELIQGHELAPEGWVQDGEVHVHGVVDLGLGGPHGKSIEELRLPSAMPEEVQRRAIDAAGKLMRQIGFDDGCFNMEFFWDDETDDVWVVEVNPRISQSHTYIFEQVYGQSNHEVAVSVALGERPQLSRDDGELEVASKFWFRSYAHGPDATIARVPTEEDIAELRRRYPESRVVLMVEEGQRLRDLEGQDSYSSLLAEIKLAAHSRRELEEKYAEAKRILRFEIRDAEGELHRVDPAVYEAAE